MNFTSCVDHAPYGPPASTSSKKRDIYIFRNSSFTGFRADRARSHFAGWVAMDCTYSDAIRVPVPRADCAIFLGYAVQSRCRIDASGAANYGFGGLFAWIAGSQYFGRFL